MHIKPLKPCFIKSFLVQTWTNTVQFNTAESGYEFDPAQRKKKKTFSKKITKKYEDNKNSLFMLTLDQYFGQSKCLT